MYKKQAFWAEATFFIGAFGTAAVLATLIYTIRAVQVSERSARAAFKQSEIAEKSLVVANRPWMVFVSAKVIEDYNYRTNGANFTIQYTAKNVGNSPSIRTRIDAIVYLRDWKAILPPAEVRSKIIPRNDHPIGQYLSFAIAPNDTLIQCSVQAISYDEIRDCVESYRFDGKIAFSDMPTHIIGVISYQSAFSSEWHETTFFLDVKKLEASSGWTNIKTLDTDIPAHELGIFQNIISPTSMS